MENGPKTRHRGCDDNALSEMSVDGTPAGVSCAATGTVIKRPIIIRNRAQNKPFKSVALLLWLIAVSAATPTAAVAEDGDCFETLCIKARAASGIAYKETLEKEQEILDRLDYDAWGAVRFRPESAVHLQCMRISMFPIGRLFRHPVKIYTKNDRGWSQIRFDKHLFDYSKDSPFARWCSSDGFAGFKVHESAGSSAADGDWLAFLGASYWRAIGSEYQYGASVRGIAISPGFSQPEEFPAFTEYYIEQLSCESIVIYAFLDGPSITGAFRIYSERKNDVTQHVTAMLFPRRDLESLGVAAITSMFWYGYRNGGSQSSKRPAVHDSDGLEVRLRCGDVLWRPLRNPSSVQKTTFEDVSAFGLVQKDRNSDHYRDGVFYERRPNVWIKLGDIMKNGAIDLVEIPTSNEWGDNIVAYWRPTTKLPIGRGYEVDYTIVWTSLER